MAKIKNIKNMVIIGTMPLISSVTKFAEEKDLTIEKVNPFGPEPFLISEYNKVFRDEVINTKYYEKSKSKYHK